MAKKKRSIRKTEFDLVAGENIRYHFLDSGAFSMYQLAKKWAKKNDRNLAEFYDSSDYFHYLDCYVEFISKYNIGADLYANVDVIGDAERSFRNQLYLEEKGILPVPVIHFGDSIQDLERYLERGYTHIGFGGLAKRPEIHTRQDWLDRMFDFICDTPDRMPKVKVHGFGIGGFYWMVRYPWFSVDSTSWLKYSAYGGALVPRTNRSKKEPSRWEFKHAGWFYTFRYDVPPELVDFTLSTFQSGTGNHYQSYSQKKSLRALRIEKWLEFIQLPLGETEYGETPKDTIVKVPGVSNTADLRATASIKYMVEFAKHVPKWPWPFRLKSRQSFNLF
jgi:hypothetical protein